MVPHMVPMFPKPAWEAALRRNAEPDDQRTRHRRRAAWVPTLLQFVQEYAQELSDETYGTYNFNWGYYLNSLKLLCETGEGTPFGPPAG